MEPLTIQIGWEYFLGIMAALIGVAGYSSGRFTALETSMKWVEKTLKELKLTSDNATNPAFEAHSPINLNALGERMAKDSGLKEYIDKNKPFLLKECKSDGLDNPYEVQQKAFALMDNYNFDDAFYARLQNFAYKTGTSIDVIRRVGGIYLRNICLDELGMNRDDIDKHTPE